MIEYEITGVEGDTVVEIIDSYHRTKVHKLFFPSETLTKSVAGLFTRSLVSHITYVRQAGETLGVSQEQLREHDDSKWTYHEFPAYAAKFHGDDPNVSAEWVNDNYSRAWLHHIHYNPHHWQHWIFPDGYSPKESGVEKGVVRMPDVYALEMVADWMGASMAYSGSFDMKKWLTEHKPKIRLHSKTATYVDRLLDSLGYTDIAQKLQWAA